MIGKGVAPALRGFVDGLPRNVIYPIIVLVLGGLVLAWVQGWLDSGSGAQKTFLRAVDGNVGEQGAGVFESASPRGAPVSRVKPGHRQSFIGFCVGESVPSVANGTPDELWFILPNHHVMSGAMLDGDPPTKDQPMHCLGEHAGPQSPSLTISTRRGTIVLRAKAQGASLVGFAVRRTDSDWKGLPLAAAIKDTFSDQAGRLLGQFAAIAVACWARGAPASVAGNQEYAQEMRWPRTASRQLRTTATETLKTAVNKACSPEEREVHHGSQHHKSSGHATRKSPDTTPVVTVTTEGPTTPNTSTTSSTASPSGSPSPLETNREHTTPTHTEEEKNYSPHH
jgi:hypothetical protein